jgi:hypothetical protein
MALLRAAGLCRLALRTQWAAVRLLSAAAAGGESSGGEARQDALEALRRERALRPPAAPAAPPRKPSTIYSSPTQRALNKSIVTCASVDGVLDLVAGQTDLLNAVSVSTALLVLARLQGKVVSSEWLKGDARFRELMRTARSLMQRWLSEDRVMDAQGLSNMLYACGQLSIVPPPSWREAFWAASGTKMESEFGPQNLSNTIYACGQLELAPPEDWQERFWQASAAKLGDFSPQNLSNTTYACGQLGLTPPANWLERFWLASATKLGDFKPQELSNTLYACGQLSIMPPDFWLPRFWHASAATLGEFDPQAFSNTLYACMQLSITPPDYWLPRFWHASAVKLSEFVPQALSNSLHACGKLAIIPPADWMQRFWHVSAAKFGDYKPQELSNTLYACGLLDSRPPAVWLELFSSASEQLLPAMNQQNLANTALALAMLRLWELPRLWRGLWERLCDSLPHDITGWSADDRLNARQMYQAYQTAAVERPGLLSAPSPVLLAAAHKSWVDGLGTDVDRTSRLQAAVSDCLTRMGVAHANERWCERAERSIDIAIEGGAVPIAVEVDGPHHFLQDGRSNGSTMLRNRMLAAHGWRVVVVDYRAWEVQQTPEQREEYLRGLLEAQT